MNPPATSQTRLKLAAAVSARTLAETMIETDIFMFTVGYSCFFERVVGRTERWRSGRRFDSTVLMHPINPAAIEPPRMLPCLRNGKPDEKEIPKYQGPEFV
jgi:hypothetical protein